MVTEKSKVCRTVYMIFCYLNKNGWGKINIQVFACMCTAYLWEDTQEMELGVSRKRNWRRENRSGKQVILLYLKNPIMLYLKNQIMSLFYLLKKQMESHKEQKQNKPCSQDKLPRFWPSPCLTLQSYIKPPSLSLSFSLCLSLCLSLYLSVAQSPSHTCTCMCTGFFLNF